jgi:hypothetical protein
MQLWDRIRDNIVLIMTGVAALAVVLFGFWLTTKPAAADGLPSKGGLVPVAEVAAAQGWNGIGVGVYGSWIGGQVDGGPFSPSAEGSAVGGQISYSAQAGIFVAEVFGEYGFIFGDLKTIGAENEFAAGAKAGLLMHPSTLIYGLAAKSWIDPKEGDLIDGWQFGGGVAVRVPSTPLITTLEYRRGFYDIGGYDVTSDTVRVGLTYRLGGR